MSFTLLQAVLSSNHTKSSTRFAQVLLAYHACPRCGRVYCSVARLAREMNIDPRNAKTLIKKLREEKCLEPTGETTPDGIMVYRLRGVMLSSPEEINPGDESITGGVMKSCRFCRREVMNSSPNRQKTYRQENNKSQVYVREICGINGCEASACPHSQLCTYHAACEDCAREEDLPR
jgi:hypothetical protein